MWDWLFCWEGFVDEVDVFEPELCDGFGEEGEFFGASFDEGKDMVGEQDGDGECGEASSGADIEVVWYIGTCVQDRNESQCIEGVDVGDIFGVVL